MFTRENFNQKIYLWLLAVSTVGYFLFIRLLQDWLYHGFVRPVNLFSSFGPFFDRPEPYEMPLYFLGFLLIPVLALILHYFYQRRLLRYAGLACAIALIAVLWKYSGRFFGHLPNLRFYWDYIQRKGLGHALWLLLTKRLFVTRLVIAIVILVFGYFYFHPPRFGWMEKAIARIPWQRLDFVFILSVALLIFHPNLPVQDHHYNYYIGTINDILHGKGLLYETTHLYGLLNVYFLLGVFKLLPFSYQSLSLILGLFFFGFFVGLYYFVKSWLRSRPLAMISTLAVIALLFFFQTSPTRSVYFFPAMGPFRFWLYLPVLFFVYQYHKAPRLLWSELALGFSALAVFWNFDSGVAVVIATFFALVYQKGFSLKAMTFIGLRLFAYILIVFGSVSLINFWIYGSFPHWLGFVKEILPFGQGIGLTPLPGVGVFDLFVFLFLVVGLLLFRDARENRPREPVVMFLLLYGIFSALYYVGESTWQNLYLISVPPILLFVYLYQLMSDNRMIRAGFSAFLVFTFLLFSVKLPVEFKNRDYFHPAGLTEVPASDDDLYADAVFIREHYPDASRIPLIYLRDTKFLYYAGKTNALDFYYIFNLYYFSDVDRQVAKIKQEKYPVLLIGKEKNDQIDYFDSLILADYEKSASLRTLEIYTLKVN